MKTQNITQRKKIHAIAAKKTTANSKENAKEIVYQATVINKDNNAQETYVGLTEGTFKTRYLNHTSSFRNEKSKKRHRTEQTHLVFKGINTRLSIKWKIIKKCQPYSNRTKRCNLCLYEKFIIICHPELSSLNRNELVSTCRHRKRHLLANVKLK